MEQVNPLAGKLADPSMWVDVSKLVAAYYAEIPDVAVPEQKVSFGTSGHRGCPFEKSFNEAHILAITQAICNYRQEQKIEGPLFLGLDTHAISPAAGATALEVLAANRVEVVLAEGDEYTPTPVISHAILTHNRGRKSGFADGIVVTPSHNPPAEGGFKYNPPHGGPADPTITHQIENQANAYLAHHLSGVKKISYARALQASTTHRRNFVSGYVEDLAHVIDMQVIRDSQIPLAVDPLGGAGVHYWQPIAERYGLNLTVLRKNVDPTFRFMSVDWDGKIRMDPSSRYAMTNLIDAKDRYRVSFACDTDHDRHGIVTSRAGLLPPNHFLAAAIFYLFQHRPHWRGEMAVGKTVVSSRMIDFASQKVGRKIYEVPVGFKWFVEGLIEGSLAFVGEESAGASFIRLDGSVWTTDKDGMIPCLLAAEMTARMGKDPGEIYDELTDEFGVSYYERFESIATPEQKCRIQSLTPEQVALNDLAGEKITSILHRAPGNQKSIGGIKVVAETGWFVVRPSGTEDIYRIYVESFESQRQMERILAQAQAVVQQVLTF